jgi:polyisoprenyl-teichoic acid--peptidoglycan teichoic acid transferase
MTQRRRGRVVPGVLSLLLPGLGQIYVGARRRGLVLVAIAGVLAAATVAVVAVRPLDLAASLVGLPLLAAVLFANVMLLAFRLFAIVDAWRWGGGAASSVAVAALVVVAAIAVVPHVAAGYVAVRGYDVLDSVFADEEPRDVLPARGVFLTPQQPRANEVRSVLRARMRPARRVRPPRRPVAIVPLPGSRDVLVGGEESFARPWITMLLLGSDAGPGQWGERTDTMIVVALQRGTRRAVAFGIPRNLVGVSLAGEAGGPGRRFGQPLNALYAFGKTRPELFPGGRDPGATALKQTISRLLGIRVDYFALVDLAGFADLVDALGGVEITVKERLVDEVTRPRWGETKPKIDVYPGRTYRFYGRGALAYVRSRKNSNDYTRMERQRCFLSAMAQQLDVVRVLRHFGSLADTVEESIHTDVPLSRVPDLVRLAAAVDPRRTVTETFGPAYIARRRASDRYPIANVRKIRATVREAILRPRAGAGRGLRSAHDVC